MRLNMDCIREILLCVEENTDFKKMCLIRDIGSEATQIYNFLYDTEDLDLPGFHKRLLEQFDNDTILYHVNYCSNAGLISLHASSSSINFLIKDLTVEGHELLGKIRDEENWITTKKGLSSIKDFSLSALKAIAEGISSGGVSAYLHAQKNL